MAKWLQKAIKREGRFKGKSAAELQAIKARLHKKAQKQKLSKSERSELSAAQLGIRLKSGEFKHKGAVKRAYRQKSSR